jgi:hypothetical protein
MITSKQSEAIANFILHVHMSGARILLHYMLLLPEGASTFDQVIDDDALAATSVDMIYFLKGKNILSAFSSHNLTQPVPCTQYYLDKTNVDIGF